MTNSENEQLLPGHVHAAACENWLLLDDDRHFGETFPDVVSPSNRPEARPRPDRPRDALAR